MGAPMYTECVERDKYEDLDLTPEAVVAAGSFLLFGVVGLFGSLVAAMSALRKILEYMLYGKLVCLGGDRCAVGRIAAFEIMIATPSIRSLIRDNKTFRITSDLQTGAKWGMQTLDSHLIDLWRSGKIPYEELVTKAQDTEEIMQQVRGSQP